MINYERDNLLTDFGKTTLKDRYLLPEEESPQDGFMRAAKAFSDNDEMADRIYNMLLNFGLCFLHLFYLTVVQKEVCLSHVF